LREVVYNEKSQNLQREMKRGLINGKLLILLFSWIVLSFSTLPVFAVAGVNVTQTEGSTYVKEGGFSDQYFIVLKEAPFDNVIITINTDFSQLSFNSTSFVFTPTNWNIPQTVTVSAVDDSQKESTLIVVVQHSATSGDSRYNGITIDWIGVQIEDNENENISISGRVVDHTQPPQNPPENPPAQPPQPPQNAPEQPPEQPSEEQPPSEQEQPSSENPPSNLQPTPPSSGGDQVQQQNPSLFNTILESPYSVVPMVGVPLFSALFAGFPFGLLPGLALLSQLSGFWEAVFRLPLALLFGSQKNHGL